MEKEEKNTTPEKEAEKLKEIPESKWPSWLKSSAGFFWETFKIVVISLAVILPIRFFLVQPFYVRGASMEPTFHDYEYLLIDEISYRLDAPQRGDIVVFHYPEDPRQYFIKRIIGLPGERVDIQDGQVLITPPGPGAAEILPETYLPDGLETDCLARYNCTLPLELGPDQYFVMGDNRPESFDSRYFGIVDKSEIVGKAWLRVWPFSTFTKFNTQLYNF